MKLYSESMSSEAAEALLNHEILTFPTDTVYGVGVLFGDPKDLERLKNIKHRPETKAVPVMVSSIDMIEQVADLSEIGKAIAEAFLPGALTLILPRKKSVDPVFTNEMDTIAVRIPDHAFILETINKLQRPLFVTSANVSGSPAALTLSEAIAALPGVDGAVEGECSKLQASTIVDCTKSEPVVLREGPISLKDIKNRLQNNQ